MNIRTVTQILQDKNIGFESFLEWSEAVRSENSGHSPSQPTYPQLISQKTVHSKERTNCLPSAQC